jgi:hypothetical protein
LVNAGARQRIKIGSQSYSLGFELGNDDLLLWARLSDFVRVIWGLPWEVEAAGYFATMLGNDDLC